MFYARQGKYVAGRYLAVFSLPAVAAGAGVAARQVAAGSPVQTGDELAALVSIALAARALPARRALADRHQPVPALVAGPAVLTVRRIALGQQSARVRCCLLAAGLGAGLGRQLCQLGPHRHHAAQVLAVLRPGAHLVPGPTVSTAARHKEKQADNIYVKPEIYYVKGGLIENQP